MYNRYLEQAPERTPEEPHAETRTGPAAPVQASQPVSAGRSNLLGDVTGGLNDILGGVLKNFSLKDFDTGDILLLLIILFLFLEGDNLEIVITLGLMLLLGLEDDR